MDFDAFVPFNAVNSLNFQPKIDTICSMGPKYKAPSIQRVRGFLFIKMVDDVKKLTLTVIFGSILDVHLWQMGGLIVVGELSSTF